MWHHQVAPSKAKRGKTDGMTDDRQSDPYVALCFAGATINLTLTIKCINTNVYTIIALGCHCHTTESYLEVREPSQISFFSQTNTS